MKSVAQYNSDEMREIAREYESQWVTDESSADVDKYDFTFEKYDLTNLKRDYRRFLESEYKLWLSQFGEEDADERLMYFMEEYPFDEESQKNDPLIIIEKDGRGYVWDGTHRTSGLLDNNVLDAWAIVGRPKEELSESGSRGGSKLNLKQALEIKENQYRSKDARYDYQPEEIDERIIELQTNKDERHLKLLEKQMEEWPDDIPWPSTAISYSDLFEASKKAADEYGFDDKDMAFWQCNLFSQAVARVARYLGYGGIEPVIVDAKWQTNSGDVQLGQVFNHVLLKWGDIYVDFTIRQIDEEADFPLVTKKLPRYLMRPKSLRIEQNHGDEVYVKAILDNMGILSEETLEEVGIASTTDWPPEWLGYGVTEKDLAFLYAVADNFTGFLTEEMLEDYEGTVYRKSEHDEENHDSFWTSDKSVADKFEGKLRMLDYAGKAWLVSKYLSDNHQRLAKIKHELGGESRMWELEELVATGLAYNSTEAGSVVIPDKNVKKENIVIVEE